MVAASRRPTSSLFSALPSIHAASCYYDYRISFLGRFLPCEIPPRSSHPERNGGKIRIVTL